uniref:Secreted protein n=1 Tax=Physcomitrium patens TaxID=3218 RepID=A0A2K1JQ00_PHYPA|nr:hypothetical protein PHYPA_015994 [Physcomitrium patens]
MASTMLTFTVTIVNVNAAVLSMAVLANAEAPKSAPAPVQSAGVHTVQVLSIHELRDMLELLVIIMFSLKFDL